MTIEDVADHLLWPCWGGIPSEYKAKYARNIWPQFEDNIRSAAYTSSLPKFFEALRLRLNIEIRTDDLLDVQSVIGSAESKTILRSLRDETTALVLLVRLRNEVKKDLYKASQEAKKREREEDQNAELFS